jgi:hypothetical protein
MPSLAQTISLSISRWMNQHLKRQGDISHEPPERQAALRLVAALDAGGVPLNPAKVNQIARGLGLEVSSRAPMDQTIERIRAALLR